MSTSSTVRSLPGFTAGMVTALIGIAAVVVFLVQAADGDDSANATTAAGEEPAHVEHVEGSEIARVTLPERAAERVDLQTASASDGARMGAAVVLPFSALLYGADGRTWVYATVDELTYERVPVAVKSIRGERVLARRGPQPGTEVVVVGAPELWGAEFGVGH